MFNTTTKPTPFKMDLKRATIANNSTAISSHHQTNQLKRQTFYQSKLLTTRQSIFNPRSTYINNQSSISQTQRTFNAERTQRDQNIDTSQISALISIDIKNDQKLSKRDLRTQFRSQTYILTISKVVTQESRPIPQIVMQAYKLAKDQKSSQNQKVSFCQGYLEKANIIYYAVQKELFLFNGQQLCNSKVDISRSSSYKRVVLKDILFKIYQVSLKNNLIQRKMQNKILLFSYPYQIQFCAYENSSKSSQIKLIDLEFAYALDTKKGQFFQSTIDGKIIYLDNDGKLNYISTQQNKTLGLIGNGKYGLKNNTASRFIRNQFWANQEGIWNKIRLAYRKATNYTASLLPFKHQNCNLIYDQKRRMIFTLTDYTENKTFQIKKKIIKVFNIVDSDFIPIWSISQQQILENVASKAFFKTKSTTTGIKDICKVEKDYIKQSNLMLILKNATRVYLDITQDKVNVSQIIYAPQFSSLQSSSLARQKLDNLNSFNNANTFSSNVIQENASINFQKELKINQKQSSQTQIKCFYSKNSIFITLAIHQKNVYSLLYNKETGQSQNQKLMNIQWKDKITNESQLPQENYFYKIRDNFMIETESMHLLSNDNQICDSFEYLRQVFYPPLHYYYCNDIFVSKFFLLRPIDILFSVIQHHTFFVCQTLLPKLFNNVSLKQICVMLIQIYTNQQGIYYESSNFNQSIAKLVNRQFFIKNSRNSQVGYRVTGQQSKKKFVGKNIVKKVQFKQISRQILGLIQKLFTEFSCHNFVNSANQLDYFFSKIDLKTSRNWQQKQIQRNKNLIKNQFGSIILYVSRIYHPLWDKLIEKINEEQSNSYLQKIRSLKKISVLFKNNSTEQVATLKLDGFFQKSVQILNMISVIKNFPKITFQECFQKDAKFFQEYIFKAIDKFYQSNILSKFQNLFPIYLSTYFKKIIKMYEQVRSMSSHSKIMELLKQQPCLPRYFIQYLVNIRQINQARILRVQGETRVTTTKLRIPGNLTRQGEINFIFQQVKRAYRPINQKLYFLQLAQQRIQQLIQHAKKSVNYSNSIITEMKQTHQEFSNCLKLQKLMKHQYENLEGKSLKQKKNQFTFLPNVLSWTQNSKEAHHNSLGLNDQILTMLQNRTYTRQNLRVLLQRLNTPKLLIIFYTLFGQGRQYNHQLETQWEKLMISLKQKTQMEKGSDRSLQKFTKQIKSVVREMVEVTKDKLNIKIMMKCIDKQFCSSTIYMEKLKSRKNGECFILGSYLGELNCYPLDITSYYYQIMQEQTINQQKMKNMEIYFYIWFNCLQFITKFSLQNIRKFVIFSQEYIMLDSKRNPKQFNDKIEINVMKLQLKKLQK